MVDFLTACWSVLAAMAPYLLLGFFVAGLLSEMVSPEWVERHLGGRGIGQVVKASLFGVPLPLCSCGVIPVAASLRRHGASRGATTAFLLSTPQTGVDSIAVTYGLLGPFIAVLRPVAAFVTGLVGGSAVHALAERNGAAEVADEPAGCSVEGCCDDTGGDNRFVRALRYGFVTLPRDIGRALVVGILLSGAISAVVAPDALGAYLGGGLVPMLAAMAIGIPLYVCATASTPIALSLIYAGLSPGAALVFLITGPATNGAALTTLWKVLGRRTAIIYLVTVAVCALATGFAVDAIIDAGVLPAAALVTPGAAAMAGHEHHETVGWFGHASALLLLAVLVGATWPRRSSGEDETAAASFESTIEMRVRGMNCNGCVQSLSRALRECSGVADVDVRLEGGVARVQGRDLAAEQIEGAVRSLGFEVDDLRFVA